MGLHRVHKYATRMLRLTGTEWSANRYCVLPPSLASRDGFFFIFLFSLGSRIVFYLYISVRACVLLYIDASVVVGWLHTRIVKFNFFELNAFSAQIHILKGEEEQGVCETDIVMWRVSK